MKKYNLIVIALIISLFSFFPFSARADDLVYGYAKQMGGTGYDYVYSIAVDSAGAVYTTGGFTGTVDFDPGAGTANLTSAGGYEIFISKLDSSGNFVYVKQMGGTSDDSGASIVLDSAGNVYTTGSFQGTADFDPGVGVVNLISVGFDDIFISKLTSLTAPTLTTDPATSLTTTGATLNGNITATGGGSVTERGFNWGLTNSYGTNVVQSSGPYGTGVFTTDLAGLTCGTTYNFRVYAINSIGTTNGSNTIFTTSSCPHSGGGYNPAFNILLNPIPQSPTIPPPTIPTACPTGDKFSAITGQPCTSFTTPTVTLSTSPDGSAPQTSRSSACTLTLTLKRGSKGTQVACLQTKLHILSDGLFGPITKATVILFQKSHTLVPRWYRGTHN